MSRRHSGRVRCRVCHERLVFKDGLCVVHQPRELGLVTTVMEPPVVCPHCRSTPPGWVCDALYGSCFYCGQDWCRPLEVVGAL